MIVVSLLGGMGNQMFQYALGRSLSIKYGVPLKFDVALLNDRTPGQGVFREYELELFDVTGSLASREEIPFRSRLYFTGGLRLLINRIRARLMKNKGKEKVFGGFSPEVLSIGPNMYLEGYWQSERYFADIAENIRKDFTLKGVLPENIQNLMTEISSHRSVCVHVRRTDYVGNAFTGTLDATYYDAGIAYLSDRGPIDRVYVFSDDIEWCRESLHLAADTFFVGSEYSGSRNEGHFELMRACRHFIIPNSTYSWWAAWLSPNPTKIVIAPKKWFAGQTSETDEIVPKSWIRI